MELTNRPTLLYPQAERDFFYVNKLFVWIHSPKQATTYHQTIILCAPLGHEYTHAHRSFKHLAEYLATQGFYVFRFDYEGTGDSAGTDRDEHRIQTWVDNICTLATEIKLANPQAQLSLIGLRLGATLAALASQKITVDNLILWEPIIKGSSYVRELSAIAKLAANQLNIPADVIESAGFLMTEQTAQDIKAINLTQVPLGTKNAILLIRRDDRQYNNLLSSDLQTDQEKITEVSLPGYADMIEEPQETKVPFVAFEYMIQWLNKNLPAYNSSENTINRLQFNKVKSISFEKSSLSNDILEESAYWYNNNDFLFGINTQLKASQSKTSHSKESQSKKLPTIILLNSGSVHHVGPNRVYVTLARELAKKGFGVFRIDLEGIGDSASAIPNRENHPYQPNAVDNTFSAMTYLKNLGVAETFILAGICSGAHTAFHCALRDSGSELIERVVLINPLTFYWKEGMSLATSTDHTQTFRDKNRYMESIRDGGKWKKLLLGQVSLVNLFRFGISFITLKLKAQLENITELFFENKEPLTQDFNRLIKRKTPIDFIFSSGEPGIDIIKKDAKRSFSHGIATSIFNVVTINNADHTFSKELMRLALLEKIHPIFNRSKCESIKK
jgi:alpha-beta hydrolase superfamily lysophospholipase